MIIRSMVVTDSPIGGNSYGFTKFIWDSHELVELRSISTNRSVLLALP